MRRLKQEMYFPIIIGIHLVFWVIDLSLYKGSFTEVSSDTLLFGKMTNEGWFNFSRIFGEVLSSWVITVFAANFLMATRSRWIEKLFGGLDKMYLIHKRAAVIATVLIIAHFIFVPRDLTSFTPGKPMGFYAMALILLGVVVSAVPFFKKKVPYHKWLNFHRLMGIFYVLAIVHGAMVNSLIKELPITRIYVFGMSLIGIGAWFYKAFLFGLFNKKLSYEIVSVKSLGNGLTELILLAKDKTLEYTAGQFAFFTFPEISKKEQHPFTISSHPLNDHLRITIKNLGDYTAQIDKLTVGGKAIVEGPYGMFSSKYAKEKEQVWIAGGIGITPFLSLSKDIYTHQVKLYWGVKNEAEAVYKYELEEIAKDNPNFDYSIWPSDEKGHMAIDGLEIENLDNKAFFICGPEALKKSLMKQLLSKGVKMEDIYDEEFAFR